jgi:hypothetical protein
MRVYTCTGFEGHHPVGTSAVIVAPDIMSADLMLRGALGLANLDTQQTLNLIGLDLGQASVKILNDGDY